MWQPELAERWQPLVITCAGNLGLV
ncbi:hypothetical protein LCGC14_2854260, partial [marine sediment metagenome]